MLLGVTLAAVNAFLIARGVGRPLAQKVRGTPLHAMAILSREARQVPRAFQLALSTRQAQFR